ncbi:MAG: hypothetical protein M0042_05190 [Nitrospiraceae bacterium]|nr:hypothetical protein [Nitrospiraceae bacterium]
MRYSVFVLLLAAFFLLLPAPGFARPPLAGEVSVEIRPDNGAAFPSYPHQEFRSGGALVRKQFLEARKQEHYGIVIRNHSGERVGVVIAVDGRNIITGKRSDLKPSEMMYILDAWGEVNLAGWRTSDSEVHRFYFTEPADSYSVRTFGDTSAMGVIAVAAFREKERPLLPLEPKLKREAPAPSAAAGSSDKARAEESAGTGFGDSSYSPVVHVAFEPERRPASKTLIKYEWRETLCRKGIIACAPEQTNRLWDSEGYAPYPPKN